MKNIVILTFSVVALLAAGATLAQPPQGKGGPWERLASRLDANQDGQVTAAEFDGGAELFADLDANGDGVLTVDDFGGRFRMRRPGMHGMGGPGMGGPGMERGPRGGMVVLLADADHDATVTAAEWDSFLAALDGNADGLVSREEIEAQVEARRGDRPGRGGHRDGSPGDHLAQIFDRDGDGAVEVADFEAIFAELDEDGDGSLADEELPFHRFREARHRIGAAIFIHLADGDDDGTVTRAEWDAFAASLDANSDGVIDEAEFLAAVPPPPGGGVREPRRGGYEHLVERADRDGNGTFGGSDLALIFDELDADHSGVLEADEVPHFRHRGGRRG